MKPTTTTHDLEFRAADFPSLTAALDYAAQGATGMNFYSGRGELQCVLPYAELRRQARGLARRLLGLGTRPGARVALIAETDADFVRFFFACQYAGMVPVPLPISVNLGSHRAYVNHLRGLLIDCQAQIAMAPHDVLPFIEEAAEWLDLRFVGDAAAFDALPALAVELSAPAAQDLAYIQYTSGSTRFPRGVMIDQSTIMHNLGLIIRHGVQVRRGDRCLSWLPFYHDMGLVGMLLAPVACQLSVDYIKTRDFAMRPRLWMDLMTRTRASISFGPPFGYDLVARRLRPGQAAEYDLSRWRVAGVGAEMIRAEVLQRFAERLAPAGFRPQGFSACYGMAECALAVSFAPLGQGLRVDRVDGDRLSHTGRAVALSAHGDGGEQHPASYVDCGPVLPELEVEIRDAAGQELPDRQAGEIFVRGPSVMSGYFGDPEASRKVLTADGWLKTGDIGYRADGHLFLTGRRKDLIIVNGRNIWPQDLEYIAEQQPEVRPGDALAFAAPGEAGAEQTVLVVQCRESDPERRSDLIRRLRRQVYEALAVDCVIDLVPLHTLPRTSSGKLSRSWARLDYLGHSGRHQRGSHQGTAHPGTAPAQSKAV
jgi:fatty-acyl-CoA synthase